MIEAGPGLSGGSTRRRDPAADLSTAVAGPQVANPAGSSPTVVETHIHSWGPPVSARPKDGSSRTAKSDDSSCGQRFGASH